jgi:hypothetical protein
MKPQKEEEAKPREHECNFDEACLEGYLHYDDANEFVQNIIVENLQDFEEAQDQKLDQETEEMKDFVEERIKTLDDYIKSEVRQVNKKVRDGMTAQDDQLDIISVEIHKDSKRKSDQDLELKRLTTEFNFFRKKVQANINDMSMEFQEQKQRMTEEFQDLMSQA